MKLFITTLKVFLKQLFENKSTFSIIAFYYITYVLVILYMGLNEFLELFYGIKIVFTIIFIIPPLTLTINDKFIDNCHKILTKSEPINFKTTFYAHITTNFIFIAILLLPAIFSDHYLIIQKAKMSYFYFSFECFKNIILILFYISVTFIYRFSRKHYDLAIFLSSFGTFFLFLYPLYMGLFLEIYRNIFKEDNIYKILSSEPFRLSSLGLFFYNPKETFNIQKLGDYPNDIILTIIMALVSIILYKYFSYKNMDNYIKEITSKHNENPLM